MISIKGLRQFEVDLNKFAEKIGETKQAVFRRAALDIWKGVTMRTPVDTGRARSSWNIAVGNPDPSFPPSLGTGTGAHKGELKAPESPVPPEPMVSAIDGNQTVWITSNLPYIVALENGHSTQTTPGGMVSMTVAQFLAEIRLYTEQTIKEQ